MLSNNKRAFHSFKNVTICLPIIHILPLFVPLGYTMFLVCLLTRQFLTCYYKFQKCMNGDPGLFRQSGRCKCRATITINQSTRVNEGLNSQNASRYLYSQSYTTVTQEFMSFLLSLESHSHYSINIIK